MPKKTLLDRLFARQARLVAALGPHAPESLESDAVAPVAGELKKDLPALRAAEDQALEAVREPLSRGAIGEAAAVLQPHALNAQRSQTLVTLARIRSLQGNVDEAMVLLRRADALDPSDIKVPHFFAELLENSGRPHEALAYRRRVAFFKSPATADSLARLVACLAKCERSGSRVAASEIRLAVRLMMEAPDLTSGLRLHAARHLYSVREFAALARTLVAEASPDPGRSADLEVTWQPLAAWAEAAAVQRLEFEESRPIYCLNDVDFMPGLPGIPVVMRHSALGAPLNIRPHYRDPTSPMLLSNANRSLLRVPTSSHTIEEPCVYVGGSSSLEANLLMHVGALSSLELQQGLGDLPLLVHGEALGPTRQLLEALGLSGRRLLVAPSGLICHVRQCWFPARTGSLTRRIDRRTVEWYRQRAGNPPSERRRVICRSTSVGDDGSLSNWQAIEEALRPHGFESIDLDATPVNEMIALIRRAEHLVMADSPFLSTLVFASQDAKLTLLTKPAEDGLGGDAHRIEALVDSCGLKARLVACARSIAIRQSGHFRTEFVADIPRLEDGLEVVSNLIEGRTC
jgi:tetratricopeptide (TPR) repeat protein